MFKAHDVWGVIAGIFVLILVYLILKNDIAANQIAGTAASGSASLIKVLQGR